MCDVKLLIKTITRFVKKIKNIDPQPGEKSITKKKPRSDNIMRLASKVFKVSIVLEICSQT